MNVSVQTQLCQTLADSARIPLVMGVLNITPDSFSDGGEYLARADAVARARQMIDEGADIIDVGPESTRPAHVYTTGFAEVPAAEQITRAVPVIRSVREMDSKVAISVDTRSAAVARAGLDAGADMINDVSALRDDREMVALAARAGAPICLMHRRGTPANMQARGGPHYDDVIGEIAAFLRERTEYAVAEGIDRARIIIDPGIGFGKRVEHNLLILKHLARFVELGQPVLIGASRKSFIGKVLGVEDPKRREVGSLACAAIAVLAGAAIIRTHDVRSTVETARLCAAVRQVAPRDKRREELG